MSKPSLDSHSGKHSKVIGRPDALVSFVAHDRTVFDRAGSIKARLRDKNIIDAPVRPWRPRGKVIAPGPRGAFTALARMIPRIAPIGAPSLQRLQSFEIANFRGFRIGVEIAN